MAAQRNSNSRPASRGTGTAELSPEEIVSRLSDDDLFGTKPLSRPGSSHSTTMRPPAVSSRRPSSSSSRGQQNVLTQLRNAPGSRPRSSSSCSSLSHSALARGGILRPASVPDLRSSRISQFHFMRQRKWLEGHNKQNCLSFTEQETIDFRRFFKALAKGGDTISLDRFEDMLICLDLAKTRKDIHAFTEVLDDEDGGKLQELSFEDFLKAFENNLSTATMDVLKLLLQDKYDARDLEYPTFISERRRELIFSATGARGPGTQAHGAAIVKTFADIFEDRCYEFGNDGTYRNEDGCVNMMGELRRMWQVACLQHGLARTLTAEERARSVAHRPQSPRTVISNVMKAPVPKTQGVTRLGRTIMIEADSELL